MRPFLAAGIGYLLGTIPSADVAARVAGGGDLRASGSGNPGAANAAAELGPSFGLAVLACDIAKGATAANVGRGLAAATGMSPAALAQVGSVASVVGHCYPVWNGFRGGKGVATSVGQVLATFPVYFPIDAAVAIATAASPVWKQRAFGATATASAVWVLSAALWANRQWPNAWGPRPTAALPVGAIVSSAVIIGRFIASSPPPGADDQTEPDVQVEPDDQAEHDRTEDGVEDGVDLSG